MNIGNDKRVEMIHIITKNTYLRLGLIHLLEGNDYCISSSENTPDDFEKELLIRDLVIYHVDQAGHTWVPDVLSISYKARVILIASSPSLRMSVINNVIDIVDESSPIALIESIIKANYLYENNAGKNDIRLTEMEHYILFETIRNTSMLVIARLLHRSVKTIYAHRSNAYRKLGIKTIHGIFMSHNKQ
ncbi:hypothetical protein H8I91_19480 [Serratia fonticola]|uniref:LuxR C-terminal-related transcriptional regulator n=1 Tax=Serratia fonticola TaxID=47917 RepID=UPI0016446C1B|nr:LuxR C-terminal-related transcriptional regulator [Serratia fonticola]MBC3252449.1 hypothetical protein [Serratia fonticola]